MKAYAALAAFKMEAKFTVWLYRIAFNAAASKWRRKQLEWCDTEELSEISDDSDNASQLINTRHLAAALEQLTELK